MKFYTNNVFRGHYPVGTAAVVVAKSEEQAAELLNMALRDVGLEPTADPEDMEWVDIYPQVKILCDGGY